jgi:prepilin-type N-terminal cleavage/methylation domain-containing protein
MNKRDSERARRGKTSGLTLIELLVVIFITAIIALILLPTPHHGRANALQTQCVINLRQMGTAVRLWADDHGDRYPMQVSTSDGGAMEFVALGDVIRAFRCMSNELSTPKLVCCPADMRDPASNFASLTTSNVSYFIGMDAEEKRERMFLAGDRNWVINGKEAVPGLVSISTNDVLAWNGKLHKQPGNVCLADGSAQKFTSPQLQAAMRHSGTNVNRLVFP